MLVDQPQDPCCHQRLRTVEFVQDGTAPENHLDTIVLRVHGLCTIRNDHVTSFATELDDGTKPHVLGLQGKGDGPLLDRADDGRARG